MNQAGIHIIETVLAFAMVISLTVVLKKKAVLKAGDVGIFAGLLTQIVLPTVIFFQFLHNPPNSRHIVPILAMVVAGCLTLLAAWLVGRIFGLSRGVTGALMMVSAFGSSALLGYPLIKFTFPEDPEALTEAIVISELAVGLPIFTFCPVIAMYFGESQNGRGSLGKAALQYFRSPIFIAVVLGFIVSRFGVDLSSPFVAPVMQAADIIDGTLAALACLVLGLQIEIRSFRKLLLPLAGISAFLGMGFQPLVAYGQALIFNIEGIERQVLILIAALPSAVLGPVFAARHKCEGELASALSFINIILGAVMIPLIFWALGK